MIDYAEELSGRIDDPGRMRVIDKAIIAVSLAGGVLLFFM